MSATSSTPAASHAGCGPLLIIGGAEDPDASDMRILPRFVELAGGSRARVLICSAATAEPASTHRGYRRVFKALGAADVTALSFPTRADADAPSAVRALDEATGVFLTGGDQIRLTSHVAGTEFGRRLVERSRDGLLVAGTSAGAAAMPSTMIARGPGSTVCRACVDLAPGLGLWPDVLVDTHFDRSGRVHRVMAALAQNPGVLGLGIDEDTAVEVDPDGTMRVLGRGVVTVFDGRVRHTNVADVAPDEPIALTHATLHVLPAGYAFDLRATEPVIPDA